jgi:hypothetical protein
VLLHTYKLVNRKGHGPEHGEKLPPVTLTVTESADVHVPLDGSYVFRTPPERVFVRYMPPIVAETVPE